VLDNMFGNTLNMYRVTNCGCQPTMIYRLFQLRLLPVTQKNTPFQRILVLAFDFATLIASQFPYLLEDSGNLNDKIF